MAANMKIDSTGDLVRLRFDEDLDAYCLFIGPHKWWLSEGEVRELMNTLTWGMV